MSPIDLEQIESLGGFSTPELVEILQDFLDGLETQFDALIDPLAKGDREAFRESAHRLKGSAQMSGFPVLGKLAADCEDLAADGSPLPESATLRTVLAAAATAARQAFTTARSGPGP